MVELVIVARQMQHAVENQNLEFIGSRVTVTASTGQSDIGGDGNIATLDTGKGKNVRGLILLSETAGQILQGGLPRDPNLPLNPHAPKPLPPLRRKQQTPLGLPPPHLPPKYHLLLQPN